MWSRALQLLLLTSLLTGCATSRSRPAASDRDFAFHHDTFAFANELKWTYEYDAITGEIRTEPREPPPEYSHHCFVLARAARQFFDYARFAPDQPRLDEAAYRERIREITDANLRRSDAGNKRVVIPGYANLREFSEANETLLKDEAGGAWQSYVQRGHWRVVFPFSRAHQADAAREIIDAIENRRPPVLHLVRFPKLTINHAVLAFDYLEEPERTVFHIYDPNHPEAPRELVYSRTDRTFTFDRNDYFIGGRVDVYEVYHSWLY